MKSVSRAQFERSERILGADSSETLAKVSVIVFGIGGVGSFVAEALARAGVGTLSFVDSDVVEESNLNRQLVALHSTIGRAKVEVMRERALDINPRAFVSAVREVVSHETIGRMRVQDYSYAIDCVDDVTAKIAIILAARAAGVPVISSMGTGNKVDPTRFEIAPISKTSVCPLARVMRRELKALGVGDVPVLFSREEPRVLTPPATEEVSRSGKRTPPGSVSFVPSVAGLTIAGYVIRDILSRA